MSRGITYKYIASTKGLANYFNMNAPTLSNWSNTTDFPAPLDFPNVTVPLYDIREVEKWLRKNGKMH